MQLKKLKYQNRYLTFNCFSISLQIQTSEVVFNTDSSFHADLIFIDAVQEFLCSLSS